MAINGVKPLKIQSFCDTLVERCDNNDNSDHLAYLATDVYSYYSHGHRQNFKNPEAISNGTRNTIVAKTLICHSLKRNLTLL